MAPRSNGNRRVTVDKEPTLPRKAIPRWSFGRQRGAKTTSKRAKGEGNDALLASNEQVSPNALFYRFVVSRKGRSGAGPWIRTKPSGILGRSADQTVGNIDDLLGFRRHTIPGPL